MAVEHRRISISTKGKTDIVDLTSRLAQTLTESELEEGILSLFVPGATAGLTTMEYEPGLIKDLQLCFERFAPEGMSYHHNERWQDGNGHSHVRASLLGPSISVPFAQGEMILGAWQQIVLIDFDNRPRRRELILTLYGT